MGSFFEITAYGEKEACSEGIIAAFNEIARVERLLSVYRPQSNLSQVNRHRRKGTLSIDPELFDVLTQSMKYAEKSGGAFDPTASPLIRLWDLVLEESDPLHPERKRLRLFSIGLDFETSG
ncbi:MAG: FAD:protein FMN transferase [Candidatus Manganitrophus sp.]|nr:MAG: FAD:protein FMN transferase [Candidatus Manganitrophus sp.]